jgi:ketopantoate reductase
MFGSLGGESLKTVWSSEANRSLCLDFFTEMALTATASEACFEPLAEYHPMDFHPSRSFDARFLAFDAMVAGLDEREESGHQLEAGGKSHVDYTVGHVVREGSRVGVSTPICRGVVEMTHEIEAGKRPLQARNYADLAHATSPKR